jgi:hypothetical protein
MGRPNPAGNGVTDISCEVAELDSYWFLAVTGTVTVKGFFVDTFGNKVGFAFTGTVGTVTPKDFKAIAITQNPTGYPPTAIGVIFNASGNLYMDLFPSGVADSDFTSNAATRYPTLTAAGMIGLGRVNVN